MTDYITVKADCDEGIMSADEKRLEDIKSLAIIHSVDIHEDSDGDVYWFKVTDLAKMFDKLERRAKVSMLLDIAIKQVDRSIEDLDRIDDVLERVNHHVVEQRLYLLKAALLKVSLLVDRQIEQAKRAAQ